MLVGRQYVNQVVEAVREDNWKEDDRKKIALIERRYTKALQVKLKAYRVWHTDKGDED
jgi:hypothetical protein